MFEVGQKVFCYYGEMFPLVRGEIIDILPQYKNGVDYIHVRWDTHGQSYFTPSTVFSSLKDWQEFFIQKLLQQKKGLNL